MNIQPRKVTYYEYNTDKKHSYLQAFFTKKDIFLQKLVLDCLFPEKFLTLTIERKKTQQ